MKKELILVLIMVIVLITCLIIFTGCSDTNKTNTSTTNKVKNDPKTELENYDYETAAEKQMAMPENEETIAIIHVRDFGDITVKFFDQKAPKAVKNFIEHAKEGYYDGVKFHRVINDFMIQSGDPEGTGRGGESIWNEGFEEEFDYGLVPYKGSLCMASSGVGTSSLGSQFFITQANYNENMEKALVKNGYPKKLIEQYKKYGGYLSLFLSYTVFGQVVDGMEVVDNIASVQVEENDYGELSSPVNDVIIDSIEVTTYKAK